MPLEDFVKSGYKKDMNYNPHIFWLLTGNQVKKYGNFKPFFSHFYL